MPVVLQMLMHLGPRVYMDDFEIPFLRSSAQHYRVRTAVVLPPAY